MSTPIATASGIYKLVLSYINPRFKFELKRELSLEVKNDGSWKRHPLIESMRQQPGRVIILQDGRRLGTAGAAKPTRARPTPR